MRTFSDSILTDNFEGAYVIVMDEKINYNLHNNNNIICVANKREIELLLFMLKTEVKVYTKSIIDTEILNWLHGKKYSEVLSELKIHGTEYREFSRIIEKIPISSRIYEELYQNKEKLDKVYVHKNIQENVLLSKGARIENTSLLFFNAFTESHEIILDHIAEDHVEGVLLSEICRQASIASINLCMDSSKVFVLLEDRKVFNKFVKRDREIVIKVFSMGEVKGSGFCVLNILQDDILCVKAILRGYNFETKEEYIDGR